MASFISSMREGMVSVRDLRTASARVANRFDFMPAQASAMCSTPR